MKNRAHRLPVYDASRVIRDLQKKADVTARKTPGSALGTYTPVWSGSGATQPDIGNGTLLGTYRRDGLMCWANIKLTWGSTTTNGSASTFWTFSLPFQGSTIPGAYLGQFIGFNSSALSGAGNWYTGACMFWDPTANTVVAITGTNQVGAGPTVPFASSEAWATGDYLIITMYYPTAG
jgi:hypothetical protein